MPNPCNTITACKGKRQYTSRKAKMVASRMTKELGYKMNWYRCRQCGCHHVGTANAKSVLGSH
jgi:hypothetical protein